MEGQQGIKRKAEASPERTGSAMTSKSIKGIEMDSREDTTGSTSTSALSFDSPKSEHSDNTSVSSQGDDEDEEHDEDEDEDWGDEHEHDADDNDGDGDEYDDMGPPKREVEEHKHTLGGSEVTFKIFIQDDDGEFSDWMHTIHVHCSSASKEIGRAFGRFVRRDRITANFWRDMEEPCQELSSVAFELFDRYGRLKREFVDHTVRKGSGCWGSELDLGPLFIIEHVRMEREWRRKGVGKKMVESLIAKASTEKKIPETLGSNSSAEDRRAESFFNKNDAKENKLAFTLVAPGWLNGDISQDLIGKTPREQRDIQFATHDISVAFCRSIGFRRIGASSCFGLAVDPNHEAHKISINVDFNPAEEEVDDEDLEARHSAEKSFFREEEEHSLLMELLKKRLPLHHAALTLPDAECVKHYEEVNKLPNAKEEWKKVDKKLNTVLHIASCEYKLKTVEWLLKNADVDQPLSSARNIKGYTALEGLQNVLEAKRTTMERGFMTICISDNFSGFPIDAVSCVAALQGIKSPSRIQSLRLKFGCTCGQCVDGFFSVRMKEALLCQAEMFHDMLDEYNDDGPLWVEMHDHATRHVAPDIQRNFTTNRSLRRGFVNIFDHAADAMRRGASPRVHNVIDTWTNSGEWPPVTRSYFQRGGAPEDALRVMFEAAREDDHWAGNGCMLNNIFGVDEIEEPDELAALPHCRNDLEFGMVALMCGMPNL
ncbi:hypothetical protein VE04_02992 [Pseudogymnoascus sp. 24MN13]|nr:hypothetical protein VE04_02992 [Pseudogymnoascus sp. 24MN13]